jgi:serine/threonine-protein kinase ULK/ATG1
MKEANHPNIVQLKDILLSKGDIWLRIRNWAELINKMKTEGYSINIILEYVGGGDMRDYLKKKGRLSETEARHWLKQLAAGMKFMKNKGILHRDLKPDNLLLTSANENGVLKIADFGLGRFLHAGEVAETGGVGTPLYMVSELLIFLLFFFC